MATVTWVAQQTKQVVPPEADCFAVSPLFPVNQLLAPLGCVVCTTEHAHLVLEMLHTQARELWEEAAVLQTQQQFDQAEAAEALLTDLAAFILRVEHALGVELPPEFQMDQGVANG